MADSNRPLALDLLFVAPLPFLCDGRPSHQLGVSVFYAELLPRLAARGHRIRVLAESPPSTGGEVREGLPLGDDRIEVDWFAFDYRSGRKPCDRAYFEATCSRLGPRFDEAVRMRRPDLVVIGREITSPPILSLCRTSGLSSVVIAHGVTLAAAERADYPAEARALLFEGLGAADEVITVARHLERPLHSAGIHRTSAIANAPDAARFHPAPKDPGLLEEWGIDKDETVVAQVASLNAGKRPFDLVRAAKMLGGEAKGVVYVIVGSGPERAALEGEVAATGLTASFRFVGEVAHSRMPDVMRLADIVVLASEREGYPLVFGEAQACGRIILASNIPAAREAIVDGATGLLFEVGAVDDLAAKLRALFGDGALRDRLGRQARAAAEAWNANDVAEAYSSAFGRIVRGSPPDPHRSAPGSSDSSA